MKVTRLIMMVVAAVLGWAESAHATELSIYEIQHTIDADGVSPQDGNIVNCMGGIVVHKSSGSRTRLTLYDPAHPDGWGGIMVKDRYGVGAFADVNVGDWVSFANVEVEDFRGTTFLQYKADNDPSFTIVSANNPLPGPLVVTVDEIAAPLEGADTWIVADHRAEKYEAMLVRLANVSVSDVGYGKAYDNYILQSNAEPNLMCWASDYMNDDSVGIYHPLVEIGQNFCSVAGILEQYAGEADGIYYDYYQLLTRSTEDFTIDQMADLDGDCDVDFADLSLFVDHWQEYGCAEPDWCGGADLTKDHADGTVDMLDVLEFAQHWLQGK
jgi:hypothetical protein